MVVEGKWCVMKVPPHAHEGLSSPGYRLTLESELHLSMDRNAIEIVKELYLEDKLHYS